jgi:hypothetical protein
MGDNFACFWRLCSGDSLRSLDGRMRPSPHEHFRFPEAVMLVWILLRRTWPLLFLATAM